MPRDLQPARAGRLGLNLTCSTLLEIRVRNRAGVEAVGGARPSLLPSSRPGTPRMVPTPQMWYSKEFTAVEIVCEPVQVPSLAPMIGAPHFAHCLKKGEQRAQTFDNAFHEKAGSSSVVAVHWFSSRRLQCHKR